MNINGESPHWQEFLGIFGESVLPGFLYCATTSNGPDKKCVKAIFLSFANSVSDLLLDKFFNSVFKTNNFGTRVIKTLASCLLTPCLYSIFDPKTSNSKSAKQAERNTTVVCLKVLKAASRELLNPNWGEYVDLFFKYVLLPWSYANMVKPAGSKEKPKKWHPKSDHQIQARNHKNSGAGEAASLSLLFYGLHQMYLGNVTLANILLKSALPGLKYILESPEKYQETHFLTKVVAGSIEGVATEGLLRAIPAGKGAVANFSRAIFKPEIVNFFSGLNQSSIAMSISDLFDKVAYRAGANLIQQAFSEKEFKRKKLFDASLRGVGDAITRHLFKNLTGFKVNLSNGIMVNLCDYTDSEWKQYWPSDFWRRHTWMRIDTSDAESYPLFQHIKITFTNFFQFGVNDVISEAFVAMCSKNPKEHLKTWSADAKSFLLFRFTIAFAASGPTLKTFREIREKLLQTANHYEGYYRQLDHSGHSQAIAQFGSEENYRNEMNRVGREASEILGPPIVVDTSRLLSATFPLDAIEFSPIEK